MSRNPSGGVFLGVVGVAMIAGAAGLIGACGLDESGTYDSSTGPDVVTTDAPVSDVGPGDGGPGDGAPLDVQPLSCEEAGTGLDASCLGDADVPDGWTVVAYTETASGCGTSTDFDTVHVVTDAGVAACVCGDCTVSGSWSCGVQLWTGLNCIGFAADAGGSFCWNQGGYHYGGQVTRSGSPQCGSGALLDASASSTPATMCKPNTCSADFCGLVAQGYAGCIVNPNVTNGACPPGFPVSHVVGSGATAQCTCPSCGLSNPNADCTGTVTAYAQANCGGLVVDSQSANGTCTNTTGFGSEGFDAGPAPLPSCAPTGTPTGTAGLTGPGTVCCTQ